MNDYNYSHTYLYTPEKRVLSLCPESVENLIMGSHGYE